jgi:hypothetical protein
VATEETESLAPSFKDSVVIQKLIAIADAEEVDTEILREILWLITAQTQLTGFLVAVRRLREILECIPDTWSAAKEASGISTWQPVLDWIYENSSSLSTELGSDFSRKRNTTGQNPMQGSGVRHFPLYAMLCEPLPKGQAGKTFVLLSSHLLLGYVNTLRDDSQIDDYELFGKDKKWAFTPNLVGDAARAVRRYALADNKDWLAGLPVELAPEDFAEQLEDAPLPSDADFSKDHTALIRFLEKCYDLRDWRDGSGGGGGSGSGGGEWIGDRFVLGELAIEKIRQDPDGGEESDWGSIELVKFQTGSNKNRKERVKSGLHPDEGESDEEVLLSDFDCSVTKQDPGALGRAARAKGRHVSKSNQVFSWTYDTLADAEIGELVNILDRELKQLMACTEWTSDQLLQVEVRLFIQITLWTGCDADRARKIEIRRSGKIFEGRDATQWIVAPAEGPIDQIYWRIKALTPTYATSKNGNPNQLRPQEKFIDLADLVGLAPWVVRIVANGGFETGSKRLFRSKSGKVDVLARQWLAKHFPGGRVTLQKIESTLWSKLHRHTGDAALASCTINDKHRLASVRLHYTSPWISTLQKHYGEVVTSMLERLNSTRVRLLPESAWHPCNTSGAVGARMCPTLGAVKAMFGRIDEQIGDASRYDNRAGFIEYHNLLTLFTVQMFAYATTCRAVKTPYLSFDSVCFDKSLATLSDKDDEFKHKTRLVWIPPVLRRQMEIYDQHLFKLKAEPLKGTSKILLEPCFFLTKDYTLERVRPKSLEPKLDTYIQAAVANTHRRFLRTELLERGCMPEVVDAFMGHWQSGEEPFGVYSSFDFSEYISELRTYLEPLLSDIGLTRAITSRLAY